MKLEIKIKLIFSATYNIWMPFLLKKMIEHFKYDKILNHNFIFCIFLFTVIKWGRVEELVCPYVVVLCQLILLCSSVVLCSSIKYYICESMNWLL